MMLRKRERAMEVRKFRAPTLAEAVDQVKRELGADALIVQTRRVRPGGLAGLLGRRWQVEVTAAGGARRAEGGAGADGAAAAGAGARARGGLRAEGCSPPGAVLPPRGVALAAPESAAAQGAADELLAEVQRLGELLGCLWRQAQEERRGPAVDLPMYPGAIEPIFRALVEGEVEMTLVRHICDSLVDRHEGKGEGLLRQEARAAIERLLGPARPVVPGGGRAVALVGPTGVGKTTTVAKLAARFALQEGKSVALVTVDTFRVGAVDQLRSYAEIAGLPCFVAATPEELAALRPRLAGYDLVLIDTAGRSHRDEMRMGELAAFWSAWRPDEIHLVLSATARYSDALEVLGRYGRAGFDRLIFTKLDETCRYGLLLNAAVAAQRPVSYVTTGQRVPEDLAVARAGNLAKLLV